jgi:hypothetical protein
MQIYDQLLGRCHEAIQSHPYRFFKTHYFDIVDQNVM